MVMIRSTLCAAFVLIFSSAFAFVQKDTTELERRNGFKDIKLGAIADSVKGVKFKKDFKEREIYPAKLFTVDHPDYAKIGEVKINKIELKAYSSFIYEIAVVTDKDPRLMKALESIYGKAEYDIKNQTYFWKGEGIVLKFREHGKHHLEMVYHSPVVLKMMKTDKEKKVEAIAEDF
jgi:hypothetical protein